MNERDKKIVDTALQLFAHYGVKKTTMGEVATAAGVARQTLYNSFDGKEELIFGAIIHRACDSAKIISRECTELERLEDRLDVAFKHLSEKPFETISQMPHREEIRQVAQGFDCDRKNSINKIYNDAIADVLSPFKNDMQLDDVSFDDLCDYVRFSFEQFMFTADNLDQLRKSYAPLRALLKNSVNVNIRALAC